MLRRLYGRPTGAAAAAVAPVLGAVPREALLLGVHFRAGDARMQHLAQENPNRIRLIGL